MVAVTRRRFLALLGLGSAAAGVPSGAAASERRVELLRCRAAGFQYHAGMHAEVARGLGPGVRLRVVPEPRNPHDANALALVTNHGAHVGYVPRAENAVPSRMAAQGVGVAAEVVTFDAAAPPWERLEVSVFSVV